MSAAPAAAPAVVPDAVQHRCSCGFTCATQRGAYDHLLREHKREMARWSSLVDSETACRAYDLCFGGGARAAAPPPATHAETLLEVEAAAASMVAADAPAAVPAVPPPPVPPAPPALPPAAPPISTDVEPLPERLGRARVDGLQDRAETGDAAAIATLCAWRDKLATQPSRATAMTFVVEALGRLGLGRPAAGAAAPAGLGSAPAARAAAGPDLPASGEGAAAAGSGGAAAPGLGTSAAPEPPATSTEAAPSPTPPSTGAGGPPPAAALASGEDRPAAAESSTAPAKAWALPSGSRPDDGDTDPATGYARGIRCSCCGRSTLSSDGPRGWQCMTCGERLAPPASRDETVAAGDLAVSLAAATHAAEQQEAGVGAGQPATSTDHPVPPVPALVRRSLFDLEAELQLALVEFESTGDLTDEQIAALAARIDAAEAAVERKIDGWAAWLASITHDRDAARAEAARLSERASRYERLHERLKRALLGVMQRLDLQSVKGPRFTVSRALSPIRVGEVDRENAPRWAVRTEITETVDRRAIAEHVRATGEAVAWAEIVRDEHLRIR